MSDQHIDRAAINIRGPEELFVKAKELLAELGLDMKGFVIASLVELTTEPDDTIARLASRWPPSGRRGHSRPVAGILYAFRPAASRRWYGHPHALDEGQYDTATMDFQPVAPNRFTGRLEVRYCGLEVRSGNMQDHLLPAYYVFTTVEGVRLRLTARVHEALFHGEQ